MSEESANELLERLEQDPEFKRELLEFQNQDDVIKNLRNKGYHFTLEELKKVLESRVGRELHEEELEKVAAGAVDSGFVTVCIAGEVSS